jgi:hypothetical protein
MTIRKNLSHRRPIRNSRRRPIRNSRRRSSRNSRRRSSRNSRRRRSRTRQRSSRTRRTKRKTMKGGTRLETPSFRRHFRADGPEVAALRRGADVRRHFRADGPEVAALRRGTDASPPASPPASPLLVPARAGKSPPSPLASPLQEPARAAAASIARPSSSALFRPRAGEFASIIASKVAPSGPLFPERLAGRTRFTVEHPDLQAPNYGPQLVGGHPWLSGLKREYD